VKVRMTFVLSILATNTNGFLSKRLSCGAVFVSKLSI
jgi:hypothetical protein